ncbi:dihydrofolate reductase [Nocardioides sp.]|uniref:dihydrofolate reductase n=1 Tax=Nocardioides sp. TaxID=35761 RepID=UPI002C7696F4|nr:dihydrofolate reductase [Nocardioides sp.]HXH78777.1 dihydrofolate reductase [Nocardioides sp.]
MPSEATLRITLVAAYADNRVIGDGGSIPWHIREDFAHFKAVTMGGVLVMGRTTWDSIGRPLPGRTTIVLTRDALWSADGALIAHSLEEALTLATGLDGAIYVVGGAQVYELALPLATHQVLTEIALSPVGDVRYPAFSLDEWKEVRREARPDLGLDWVWWERLGAGPMAQNGGAG